MIQARWSLIALLFFSGVALADASDYTYVEAGYLDSESVGLDLDGFGVGGSFQFFDNFYLTLRYADFTLDGGPPGNDADGEHIEGGVGYIFGQNDRGTFFGEITYFDTSVSESSNGATEDFDPDGFGVGFGFRVNVAERGEFKLSLTRVEVDSVSDNVVNAQVVYDFFSKVSGVVELESISGDNTWFVGARYNF